MNLHIRPLESLDSARFAEIAGGYTSGQRYAVRKVESDAGAVFTVELQDLARPFVKRWRYEPETLESYRRIVADHRLSPGAYVGNLLVGLAIAEPRPWNESLRVRELHVHAAYRRLGIGRRLVEEVAALAGRAGLHVVVAETQSTNVPAIRFYRGAGFELDGLDLTFYPPGTGEVAFFMKRRIGAGR